MFERIVDRMIERAMPPDIEDPEQERVAQDAAANGIHQAARVAGIAGGALCVLIAAILSVYFMYIPRQQIRPGAPEATSGAPQARAEANAMLLQAIEDLQKRLDIYFPLLQISQGPSEATSGAPQAGAEDDAKLRQWIKDLQQKLDDVTKERDTLQGKVAALEGQAEELDRKLQAAKVMAAPKPAPQPTRKAIGPARTPVLESRPSTYECGDGRSVRDPAECKPATAAAPGLFPSAPGTYQCGDGRTVRDPAECKPPVPGR